MPKSTQQLQTIRTEGALLPPDILQRIASLKVDGVRPADYHLPEGFRINDAITQSWDILKKHWKNFQEARDLSEAIGRTTVEEATVGDSGRVQESIQGRHLITPDELISLDRQVIVFTADTKPLKLPLTDPLAYEQALSYDPPQRDIHEISDFILNRGQVEEPEPKKEPAKPPEPKPEPPKPEPQPPETVEETPKPTPLKETSQAKSGERFDRASQPVVEKDSDENDRRPVPKRGIESPDYDPGD